MGTPLTLYFTAADGGIGTSLYNAVYLANAIGDSHPGQYDITLQYRERSSNISNYTNLTFASYDADNSGSLNAAELNTITAALIDPTQNEVFTLGFVYSNGAIDTAQNPFPDIWGWAPAIRHDLTIKLKDELAGPTDPAPTYRVTSQEEFIDRTLDINSRDYTYYVDDTNTTDIQAVIRQKIHSGLKIDDGNPGQNITVTIYDLSLDNTVFSSGQIEPGHDANQFTGLGVSIENHENLILENVSIPGSSILYTHTTAQQPAAAPIVNTSTGNLTLKGDLLAGTNHNYVNSFLFNQGQTTIDHASLISYDRTSPSVNDTPTLYGETVRPLGVIENAANASLTINNSTLSQEANQLATLPNLANADGLNRNLTGTWVGDSETTRPNWTQPTDLEYLVNNQGTLNASDSTVAGIIQQGGFANPSLALTNSKLGYGGTNNTNNVAISKGSLTSSGSTIDNLSVGSGVADSAFNFSQSLVLNSSRTSSKIPTADRSLLSTLPSQSPVSLFTAKKDIVTPVDGKSQTSEYWHTEYDPNQLPQATVAAIQSILSGSSGSGGGSSSGGAGSSSGSGTSTGGGASSGAGPADNSSQSTEGDNDNLDESPENHNGLIIDGNKDGIADATQSNVAGLRRIGDGTSAGDYAALAVAPAYTLNAVTLLPITNNHVEVSLPSGGTITTTIPSGVSALLAPLEFYVEGVTPGATIEAELFIPDNFNEQTDAYMRFNYRTQRFEEYVDSNGQKLYQLLDENADGKIDRVIFSLTDGDPDWDGDGTANGVIIDPGSPIDAALNFTGSNKRDKITGNLLANTIRGKGGSDRIDGGLGRDVIRGDKGNDRITGGEHGDLLKGGHGKDRFIYHSAADSSADNPYQQDVISHFQKNDRLDLRHFDADASQAGTQHFHFIGKRFFSGKSGELRFHAGLLSADLNGDRIADFAVAIDGKLHSQQLLLGS